MQMPCSLERKELEEALSEKNNFVKSYDSVSRKCSEKIQQISGQIGVISDNLGGVSGPLDNICFFDY